MSVLMFLTLLQIVETTLGRKKMSAGSDEVDSHKYPWMVKIDVKYKPEWGGIGDYVSGSLPPHTDFNIVCTGAFIGKYGSIITASHCLEPVKLITFKRFNTTLPWRFYSATFTWGSYTLTSTETKKEKMIGTHRIIHHPQSYALTRTANISNIDLAIVHLKAYDYQPMNTTKINLGIIPLSQKTDPNNLPYNGVMAGFGAVPVIERGVFQRTPRVKSQYPKILNEIFLRYRGPVICSNILPNTITTELSAVSEGKNIIQYRPKFPLYILECVLCQESIGFEGACEGDSGSPYMVQETLDGEQRLVLRGVLSEITMQHEGQPCTEPGYPIVFTDINHGSVRWWIKETIQNRQNCAT